MQDVATGAPSYCHQSLELMSCEIRQYLYLRLILATSHVLHVTCWAITRGEILRSNDAHFPPCDRVYWSVGWTAEPLGINGQILEATQTKPSLHERKRGKKGLNG